MMSVGILKARMTLRLSRGRPLAEFSRLGAHETEAVHATAASKPGTSPADRAVR